MSLDDMLQTLAERLGCPLVLYDTDFNVVAFSVHEDDVDEVRRSVILSRRASARARKMIAAYEVRRAHNPVRLPPHDGTPARVVYPVWYDLYLVGYIAYIDHDPGGEVPARHHRLLSVAEPEIGALLTLRTLQRQRNGERSHRLLTELLSGDAAKRETAAAELLETEAVSSAAQYSTMVFRPTGAPSTGARLVVEQALTEIAQSTSLKACGAVLGQEGVVVIPRRVNPDRLAKLLRRPGLEALRAGAGNARPSLAQVHASHREAVMACRAATADSARYGQSAHWSGLGLDRLLVQLPLESLTLEDLPVPVRRLLEAPSGAKLAATLESYLDSGADAQETAASLIIHRSTLYYRLDKIREITGSDLRDGRVRCELHTGLRVAALAGLRPADGGPSHAAQVSK
ncbi:helix-turn-helix domain-containing protein [Nonomuraea sp. NPDC048916]|uniref:PucR family transcriptional regulator n=1 Tax=Nonomuraea sp. NPDC048916 TaxID=3154232 RepID=UPI00340BA1C9